ncbi:YbhB/YbcL family Raf kinase inhibitor-like protein [Spirillospora sp. CA-294931]|uniref:YbhB/YbcL family Raf kinase inhibitor-like protein n=1 Tax=Spirillospora sp. CA-294931 TaxID=3240042 RepID=UPI003D91F652
MPRKAQLPHESLPEVPSFELRSDDVAEGERLADEHVFDDWGFSGRNRSPHLSWSGFPAETKSFAVTCFDPDAPTGSGFWHWVLFDVPAEVTELATGAGTEDAKVGVHARTDYGTKAYGGAAPPPGDPHRYVFTVHALDVETLGIDSDVSPAVAGFNITAHTLARASIVPVYSSSS